MHFHRTLLPLFALAILAACSGDSTSPGQVPGSVSLTLDTLDYGDTASVNIIVRDQKGTQMTGFPIQNFVLTSSDFHIAKVNQDAMTVIGIGVGDASITARYGNLEASGVLPVRLGFAPAQKLTAGAYHTCILDGGGAAWCWGAGAYGVLGNGTEENAALPVPVAGGHSFSSIVAGYYHSCAIEERAAWCWGDRGFGELGSDSARATVPVKVSGGLELVQLAAGDGHTCGLQPDGIVYCWGFGESGQLGREPVVYSSSVPEQVTGGTRFARISASGLHTCALTRLGKAYCWGRGWSGALGTGDEADRAAPTLVADTLTFVDIIGQYSTTCGVDPVGQTFCWGYNENGEIGSGSAGAPARSPVRVKGDESFSVVSQGRAGHLCGIGTGDNRIFCWGYNGDGEVGTGYIGDMLIVGSPSQVGGLSGISF